MTFPSKLGKQGGVYLSRFLVEDSSFHGVHALGLKDTDSGWEGTVIPEIGSNLVSLRSTREGIDVLMAPATLEEFKAKTTGWGFPVLMPPNRIAQGKFTFNGRDYVFDINERGKNHIHGIVHDLPWQVVATSTDGAASVTTAIRSDDHSKIKESYPHSFELRMTFSSGGRMDITVRRKLRFRSNALWCGIPSLFNVPLFHQFQGAVYGASPR